MSSRLLAILLFALVLPAQEVPVTGYFRDHAGHLRRLESFPGAWVAPLAHLEPVRAAGSTRASAWFKTETALTLVWPNGRVVTIETDPGPVLGSFGPDGEPFAFYFQADNSVRRWNPATSALEETGHHPRGQVTAVGPRVGSDDIQVIEDTVRPVVVTVRGEVLESPLESDSLEHLGDQVYLVRRGDSLFAWQPGSAPQPIPQADGVPIGLYLRDPSGAEIPVAGSFQMPPVAIGEFSEARFRVRNRSGAVLNIQRLSIDPGPFSTFEQFYPPKILASDGYADFAVRFHPTTAGEFSSVLHVNDLLVTVHGATVQSALLEIQEGASWRTLTSTTTYDLGAVERRAPLERRIRVTPPGELPTLSGAGFALSPSDTAGEWLLRFMADKAGSYTVNLSVPGRAVALKAVVSEFAAPRPIISPDAGALNPAQQVKVQIRFAEPAKLNTVGILRLNFSSAWPLAAPDDAAIAFLPKLERTINFRVIEGASLADFGGADFVTLQTGTTAGVLTLIGEIGSTVVLAQYHLQSLPVTLTASKVSAASGNAEILLTGFDNTRSISRVSFTFYLKSGQPASPGRLEADVAESFRTYYRNNATGAFQLRAGFPVSGAFIELEGVEIELINSQGTRPTGRLRFE